MFRLEMTEANLSMQVFTKYFDENRLGKLYFPNGQCFTPSGEIFEDGTITPFHIDLRDLYKLVTGWRINGAEVPLGDIVGVIAFGSAVRHPGYKEVSTTRKKYVLFGPEVARTKQVPIQPSDSDFLVITGGNLMSEKILKPVSLVTYDCGAWIKEGGIHLVNRGIEQVVGGVQAGDTVSASAMREGVPIISNGRLGEVQSRTGITSTTPLRVFWSENKKGYLVGRIE